jgi:hypothetical protein
MSGFVFGSNTYVETGAALVAFDAARKIAEAWPVATADTASWRRFTAALEHDAKVTFEDAQSMAVPPTPFIPSATDAATAAMQIVAAFPTRSIVP